jgi:hypothetical protein
VRRSVLTVPEADWTPTDYITIGLAGWGAVLSTVLAVRQVRRDRPAVRVLVDKLGSQAPNGDSKTYWWVRVVNMNPRPIAIQSVGLHSHDRQLRHYAADPEATKWREPTKLPVTLQDFESAEFFFDIERVGLKDWGGLRGAYVRDTVDREYTGRYRTHSPQALWRLVKVNRIRKKHGLPKLKPGD